MSPLTEARSARSWCDEERAPYSTKGEKVSPLTEARSARSWCDEERAPYSTKGEKGAGLTRKSDRTARVREGEHPGERDSRNTKYSAPPSFINRRF